MKGPQFIGIGAQRAGTTWIHRALSAPPEIWLPPIKELHHFDFISDAKDAVSRSTLDHWHTRIRAWRRQPWDHIRSSASRKEAIEDVLLLARYDLRAFVSRASSRDYLRLFEPANKRGLVTGEITPSYSVLPINEIRSLRTVVGGDTKILFVVRNPPDRMRSHAEMYFLRSKKRELRNVDESELLDFMKSVGCIARTQYYQTVQNWRTVFGSENVKVMFFDQIESSPSSFITDLTGFLGVSQDIKAAPQAATNSYHKEETALPSSVAVWLAEFSNQVTDDLEKICQSNYLRAWRGSSACLREGDRDADF